MGIKVLPQYWVLNRGNPVWMGTGLGVLARLWGWVYVNSELVYELGTVHLEVSFDY